MEWTETEFSMRCIKKRVKIASIDRLNHLFIHRGAEKSFRKRINKRINIKSVYLSYFKMLVAYIFYYLTGVFPKFLYR